jgi:hypothetical protein
MQANDFAQSAYAPPRSEFVQAVPDGVYLVKRPWLSFFNRTFRVLDASGNLVAFVRHPLMRMREQFQIFADEAMHQPIATIQARQFIALNLIYDVTDPQTNAWIGTLRSRGLKSMVRDTWELLDAQEQPEGLLEEVGLSWLRRIFPILLGHWRVLLGQAEVAKIDQIFRFFVKEYRLTVAAEGKNVDTRFLLACALLALMRENRREQQ